MLAQPVRYLSRERGAAIVELGIIAPILLFISILGIEFSRSFKYVEIATMLSREASSIAYRMCSAETDPEVADRCLEAVRQRIEDFGNNIFSGTSILIGLYRYTGEPGTCTADINRVAIVGTEGYQTKISFVSDYRDQARPRGGVSKKTVCDNLVVVITEVHIPYQRLVGFFPGFFSPKEFYELAIM